MSTADDGVGWRGPAQCHFAAAISADGARPKGRSRRCLDSKKSSPRADDATSRTQEPEPSAFIGSVHQDPLWKLPRRRPTSSRPVRRPDAVVGRCGLRCPCRPGDVGDPGQGWDRRRVRTPTVTGAVGRGRSVPAWPTDRHARSPAPGREKIFAVVLGLAGPWARLRGSGPDVLRIPVLAVQPRSGRPSTERQRTSLRRRRSRTSLTRAEGSSLVPKVAPCSARSPTWWGSRACRCLRS